MFEREISVDEVMQVLDEGETIESYDRERPYPSRLLLGRIGGRTLHVVVAREEAGGLATWSPRIRPTRCCGRMTSGRGEAHELRDL